MKKTMDINLITDPKCLGVLEELKIREPIFHHPEFGTKREDYESMIEETFWEVGASGRRYSRDFVLDVLEKRAKDPQEDKWITKDFYCLEIAENNYLLTYTLILGERITRRATIWRRHESNWKIVYHQGTIVDNL
jgi:hypothetical protein